MGSLEAAAAGAPPKRSRPSVLPLFSSADANGRSSSLHRPRSRLVRFLLTKKVGYLQWVFTVAAFLLVVALFQSFLPGSAVEQPVSGSTAGGGGDLDAIRDLEFGDGIRFFPAKMQERWAEESWEANSSALSLGQPARRFGLRKPRLALVILVLAILGFRGCSG
ncbi:hypothetical protein Cni_G00089 [Canna indica]|uniref:Uncharacterized protein n=1 Tax=Canna indica TaxID=4628 RepID=A0AAQ3JKK5_9LILI|nr:hypothetical protein Cni_G00089 [Canna indica]